LIYRKTYVKNIEGLQKDQQRAHTSKLEKTDGALSKPWQRSNYLSNPYDHYDPRVQYNREGWGKVERILSNFCSTTTGKINSKNLRALGDQLSPTNKQDIAARKVINRVTKAVLGCEELSVDRCCVTGSFGKGTALPKFDIDLVVFINNMMPPFTSALEELQRYLPRKLGNIEMEMTTRYSVQFLLDGFNVDLLPAPNLVHGPVASKAEEQYQRAIEKIRSLPKSSIEKDMRYWGSSLAEVTVDFMKKQQSFVNAAVRLAKLWKSGCSVLPSTFPKWFSSFLVEIVASEAAKTELRHHPNDASLVRVFENFLKALSVPETLRIVVSDRYQEVDIPERISKQKPLVLDPVNPYCNLASQLCDWVTVKVLAATTLDILSKHTNATIPTLIPHLFAQHLGNDIPRMYHLCNFQLRGIAVSGTWLRSLEIREIKNLKGQRMNPGIEWRSKERLDTNACPEDIQDKILATFETFVNVSTMAIMHHVQRLRQEQIREVAAVSDFADSMLQEVFGKRKQDWVPSFDTHESKDISFTFGQIPIPSSKDDLRYIYLKLSANLDKPMFYRMAYDIKRQIERQHDEAEY
jgi:hypothetical protein